MQKEIKHLRYKFFVLSVSVSLVVIFIMLFILNFLMHLSAQSELSAAADMVTQTAYANIPGIDTEIISLKDVEKNADGNIPILRDPLSIESITLNGEVVCTDKEELWYSAGGGIYFGLPDETGAEIYIHKEYKFNRGNSKITIDLLDNSNFMIDGEAVKTDIAYVSRKGFYISSVWWTASSKGLNPDNVTLELDSVEIQYRENYKASEYGNYKIIQRDFASIYGSEIPQTLNNFSCFYFTIDEYGNLVEINSGNSLQQLDENQVHKMIDEKNDIVEFENYSYKCFISNTDKYKVYAYVYNMQEEKNGHRLLLVSVLSGGLMLVIVTILIYFVSGRAVKPISESMRKQKEFISNVSHELKTPITVITATAELMEKKQGQNRLTECIHVQSEKMGRLVNEMLTLTKLSESYNQTGEFKNFSLSEAVKTSALYFEGRAFEEQKEIISDIEENIFINGAEDKIDNLVGIFLDNALKYSDDKAVINLCLKKEKNGVILTCENKCSDFSAESADRLFERFYRGDESHSGEKQGFGLGLSIAKEIVELHGGKISADYKNEKVMFKIVF